MKRALTNILSCNVSATADFYEKLLGMKRDFVSDWFIILTHPDIKGLEYAILNKGREIVPDIARMDAGGVIITFVVEDCDKVYMIANDLGAEIISKPTDMPYGQRRMLLKDPDGTIIDISAPTAPLRDK